MEIVKNIRDNAALRSSFNALAEKTFGLSFEDWYQNGYWTDRYRPYCMVEDGRVLANVSVNRTDMLVNGRLWKLIQLGTVMTEESFRNRGLIRAIMEEVDRDCADADGMYLFANDGVKAFYPKFGFVPGREYICSKAVEQEGANLWKPMPMDTAAERSILERAAADSRFADGCTMRENPQLILFYVSKFMQRCVYYCKELDAWCIAEPEEGKVFIHNVFGPENLRLDAVIAAFGKEVTGVTLGFTPADKTGWTEQDWHEEDSHFFVRGGAEVLFRENRIRIPSLSHA